MIYERNYFDLEDLADDMLIIASYGYSATAALFYNEAKELIQELILLDDDITVTNLDLSEPDMRGYDKEYYVVVSSDYELSVEPAYVDGKYLDSETYAMFIDSDACSRITAYKDYKVCIAAYINKDDCDDYYEDEYDDCCEDSEFGKIHFLFNEDGALRFALESDVYIPLFCIIGKAFDNADYHINDDGKLEVDIDTKFIFDMMNE